MTELERREKYAKMGFKVVNLEDAAPRPRPAPISDSSNDGMPIVVVLFSVIGLVILRLLEVL